MIFFIAAFAVLCLWKIKFKPAGNEKYMTDYMSVDKTMAIKGIFIIIVFFSHFNSYVDFSQGIDIAYYKYFSLIGQRMVTLFMLYSGYGVMESVKKKGKAYVNSIPINRFGGVLFRFDIAILLFAVMKLLLGSRFGAVQFLLSLIGWSSLGNSNWYIFMILVTYLLSYIAFKAARNGGGYCLTGAWLTTALTAAVVLIFFFTNIKGRYWYDTVMLFPLGMLWSMYRDKIEKIINKNFFTWFITFGVVCAGELATVIIGGGFAMHELSMVLFAFAVVLFTMRVTINNPVLNWCGKHLFGLYILQRIPLIVLDYFGLPDFNIYLYFIASMIITVPFAWLFEKYVGMLWSFIIGKTKKKAK